MILSICSDPKILEIMRIVNLAINIIRIAVPIILIFVLMIKLVGAITKSDDDGLQKVMKTAPKNILAAALVFLVPFFVRMVVKITAPDSEYEKCITITTVAEINGVYEQRMEELVSRAEETLNINDYNTAYSYLKNIKDEDKRQGYEERLEKVKNQIQGSGGSGSSGGSGDSDNHTVEYKDYGPCKVEYKKVYVGHDKYEYGLCVPERYNGEKLPMIMFLHGMTSDKESSFYTKFYSWASVGFNGALNEWPKYGLKNIPAIMVMPWSRGPDKWNNKWKYIHIDAVYNEVINNYNIDTDNVCLMGGSIGGQGVFTVAAQFPTRFRSLVPMSALITKPPAGDIEYFANMPMKGFAEKYNPKTHSESYNYERKMTELFNNIGHPNDLRVVPVKHMDVPGYALTIDDNGDGISDLVYWIINGGKDPEL